MWMGYDGCRGSFLLFSLWVVANSRSVATQEGRRGGGRGGEGRGGGVYEMYMIFSRRTYDTAAKKRRSEEAGLGSVWALLGFGLGLGWVFCVLCVCMCVYVEYDCACKCSAGT